METRKTNASTDALGRKIARLQIGLALLALGWLASLAWLASRPAAIPKELNVERLNVIEADGQYAFVLANSQRPVPASIDGQVLMGDQEQERKGIPSIIFFDGKGDEVGGMLMGAHDTDDGFQAVRHLSLDAYKQDQTVVVAHYQSEEGATAGVTITDRPSRSLLEGFAQLGLEPGATREQIGAAIQALPEAERESRLAGVFGGARRAFYGTAPDGSASLVLHDGDGRPRLRISVAEDGEPVIQVLDEAGEVVRDLVS